MALQILLVGCASALWAQDDPNVCDVAGEAPDVIVGDMDQIIRHGTVGDISAYSFSTISCNVGTCWLNWINNTPDHPVISQNLYRLRNGRFEQLGQSWLKHGFFALSNELCSTGCIGTDGSHLGVNCSDPYNAQLNGNQGGLGPKSQVNPANGVFAYPFSTQGQAGDAIYKRLQVHNADIDPALNAGAQYYIEGQYVTHDDALANNKNNNASYRQVTVSGTGGVFNLNLAGSTVRQSPAISVWRTLDPQVRETKIELLGDGRMVLDSRVTDLGGGVWHYEYALYNMNSDRGVGAFTVPVPNGANITNIGFHDVDYHSGETYDPTDWPGIVSGATLTWATTPFAVNPNANAIRWGTMYNFRFDANVAPLVGIAVLGIFKPGSPATFNAVAMVPNPCDNDGLCEAGETCNNCAADCVRPDTSGVACGNGTCEPFAGEDCLSCAADCAGNQGGSPSSRFCCGDGAGQNPVGCGDNRCTTGGFHCSASTPTTCCGDTTCSGAENSCNCRADCGAPPAFELACTGGVDEDCDTHTDCTDTDCCTDASCAGADADHDGFAACDCNDANGLVWATPGEVQDLSVAIDRPTLVATLSWSPPADPGGTQLAYELLRSVLPSDFVGSSAICVVGSTPDTFADDSSDPGDGGMYSYLVRATNTCPAGEGPLGTKSDNSPRSGRTCP